VEKFPVCTHCGFTWDEYRARGLLGCPQCYAVFGDALEVDLAWFHRTLAHAAGAGDPAAPKPDPGETLAALREELAAALRREDYSEAGRLRRLIDELG
jgi:protein arginine kinase activator